MSTWSRKRRSAQGSSAPAPAIRGAASKESLPLPACLQFQQLLLSRSTEKMFEDAEVSGVLSLAGRKLKDFPSNLVTKYDISDLVSADLSSNRLSEIPASVCELRSLESLRVRGNSLRRVPSNIGLLDALTFLDLSNNQLSTLPMTMFELPLEILLLTGNRLETIPREIRQMSATLTELDVSCNQLRSIPADIALLKMLRVLNLRKNLLDQFPSELCRLSLYSLDLSSNQFTQLPLHIRKMKTLVDFCIEDNPLQSPPANIIAKGREHIFKWMYTESGAGQPSAGVRPHNSSGTLRALNLGRTSTLCDDESASRKYSAPVERRGRASRFHTVGGSDSGYASTADEHRLSHELGANSGLDEIAEYTVFSPSPDEGIQVSERENVANLATGLTGKRRLSDVDDGTSSLEVEVISQTVISKTNAVDSMRNGFEKKVGTVPAMSPLSVKVPLADEELEDISELEVTAVDVKRISTTNGNGNINNTTNNVSTTKSSQLDVSNNNTSKATDAYRSSMRSTVPTTTVNVTKPISKVAPLVNNSSRTAHTAPLAAAAKTARVVPVKVMPVSNGNTVSKLSPPTVSASRKQMGSQSSVSSSGKSSNSMRSAPTVSAPVVRTTNSNGNTVIAPPQKSRLPSHAARVAPSTSSATTIPKTSRAASETQTVSKPTAEANGNIPIKKPSLTKSQSVEASTSTAVLDNMRKVFLDRLGISFSSSRDSLVSQLADGVHLCSLANAMRLRAVVSICTPTDDNPLLPIKAKRNAESFVSACRRLGVPESSLCTASDILGKKNIMAVAKTVCVLNRLIPMKEKTAVVPTVIQEAHPDLRRVTHV